MSADTFQIKRGTTAKVAAYTPGSGELVLDTDTRRLVIGDGSTVGGVDIGFVPKGTGADPRSLQDKVNELGISVVDFMTPAQRADALSGTPVLNHAVAFEQLRDALVLHGGKGIIPKYGVYRLDTNVIGDFSQVLIAEEGAVITGAGVIFGFQYIQDRAVGSKEQRAGIGAPDGGNAVTKYYVTANQGAGNSYGIRHDYRHSGTLTSGFSLGIGNICLWDNINGGAGQAYWTVTTTPLLAAGGNWGVVGEEMNVVNRGPDQGYRKTRGSTTRWCGGIQIVPEAIDLAGSTGNNVGQNTLFAYCTAHSGGLGASGFQVKTYNGLLVETDSIGPSGRGALFSGDTSGVGSQLPKYGVEIDQRWSQGINTTAGIFTGNIALNLADDQIITWGAAGTGPQVFGNQTTGALRLTSTGAGTIRMLPGGTTTAIQFSPVASAVNFFNVFGNVTGAAPTIASAGTDADINFAIGAKGTGQVQVQIGDLAITAVGKGLRVKEGSNAKQGVATLVGGVIAVANTSVTATSRIMLTSQVDGGTPGFLRVSTRIVGTSFTIQSSNVLDTSTVAYQIFEPA